jgi:hypothetical protein
MGNTEHRIQDTEWAGIRKSGYQGALVFMVYDFSFISVDQRLSAVTT